MIIIRLIMMGARQLVLSKLVMSVVDVMVGCSHGQVGRVRRFVGMGLKEELNSVMMAIQMTMMDAPRLV